MSSPWRDQERLKVSNNGGGVTVAARRNGTICIQIASIG